MALSIEPTPQAVVTSPTPTPAPAPVRQAKDKPVKTSRKSKAAVPTVGATGKLLSSREINEISVVSQAEARRALGVSCVQMLRLEGQRALTRIQENGSRLVYCPVAEVQRLLDLVSGGPEPEPSQDGEAMS
jgi:hypothetical protein